MVVNAHAQVSYQDNALGWSLKLPKGWDIQNNSSGILSDGSDDDKVVFKYGSDASINITTTGVADEFKKNPKKLLDKNIDKAYDNYKKVRIKDMLVRSKKGKTTLNGREYSTLTVVGKESKTTVLTIHVYAWCDADHFFVISITNQQPDNATLQQMIDQAVTDITSSF